MKYILDTEYSAEEMDFIKKHNCEILSEIELCGVSFTETPHRIIKYGKTYLAEIYETGEEPCFAVLEKFKGKYILGSCYSDLQSMEEGL